MTNTMLATLLATTDLGDVGAVDVALKGGPWGLVTLCVVSILRGWLVPRTVHQARVDDLTQRANDWKAAWEAERAAAVERLAQLEEVLSRIGAST